MTNGMINRKYKDSLFRMIFREKEELLSLYNAMNGTEYSDPEMLEVNTIEDVLYVGMKNDVSFLIDDYLNLYEEQSTWNPNMPLRGVFYFSQLYRGYVAERGLDVYRESLLSLPMPKYVVFFNGVKDIGERKEVRLSDSFQKRDGDVPALECTATYLNVNYGHNQELMAQCRKLQEYAILIDRIRREFALKKSPREAVDTAVQYCIAHEVLAEFLRRHQMEVTEMILTGYADEVHRKAQIEDGRKEGIKEGIKIGAIQMMVKLLRDQEISDEEILTRVMKEFSIEEKDARQYLVMREE